MTVEQRLEENNIKNENNRKKEYLEDTDPVEDVSTVLMMKLSN